MIEGEKLSFEDEKLDNWKFLYEEWMFCPTAENVMQNLVVEKLPNPEKNSVPRDLQIPRKNNCGFVTHCELKIRLLWRWGSGGH